MKPSRHRYTKAAKFYENWPTGQYDDDAAHALSVHFDLVEALQPVADRIPELIAHGILDFKHTDAIRAALHRATS